jgi:hypothetical protein
MFLQILIAKSVVKHITWKLPLSVLVCSLKIYDRLTHQLTKRLHSGWLDSLTNNF